MSNSVVQDLSEIERAITGKLPRHATPATNGQGSFDTYGPDIRAITEDLANRLIQAGKYAREHGEWMDQTCSQFAQRILADGNSFRVNLLQAENDKLAELEKILGLPR